MSSRISSSSDCATITILTVDPEDIRRLEHATETSFVCEGCQSVHWLTLYPAATS